MSQEENKEFEMAVGTSSILESNIMDGGENFYTPMESATEPEPAAETNWNVLKNDTGQLCRSCANSSDYLIPIYEGEGLEHQLEYKIQKHLPIQVSSTDTLPLQLCYQCASTLIAWDSMINSCIEADKKLRAMQEAAEEVKQNQSTEDSQADADNEANAEPEVADSDDEPLIASKSKLLSEKNVVDKEATPLKKKILSKTKSKSVTAKTEKTVQVSKEGDDKERRESSRKRTDKSLELDTFVIENEVLDGKTLPQKRKRKKKGGKQTEDDPFAEYKVIQLNDNDVRDIIMENEKSQNSLICHVCAKEFKKIHLLQAHIRRVHERIVVAKCEICGRDFRDISNYTSHMKIHSGVKSYVCQHCGKCFAQLQGLKIHQRAHTLNFPHVCLICRRGYRTKQHLDDHSSMHTDERPFECNMCGKFFRTKVHLKSHSWIHSDKFRYYCNYCQKGFNNSSHLKFHINNHHVLKKEGS
ncbi:UNVERIFIED_CONTAM: hypothetical protein PYX00_007083 [Menopon gallinae]|uniref:Uncharacterized protein n=1 Tax=Menopon gallinae TaxID=328185 RepID=A0AAW2HHN3_9NEOP